MVVAGVTSPARADDALARDVLTQDALTQDALAQDAQDTLAPGIDAATRAPATFFRINDVLAKLDAMRGRGPNAVRLAALTPSNIATDAAPERRPVPAKGDEPFGLFTFRAPEGLLWQKWRGLETRLVRDAETLKRCESDAANCPSNAAQFLRLIGAAKAKSGRARLDEVNRAVNMVVRYVSDYAQHGEADRWSSPLETFATAKGDCEDYAIAKYVALHEAGFPREDLRLVLVRDRAVRQDHAVLAARLEGQWLVLDNRRSELIEDSGATNLAPLFAIDHAGVHLFAAPYAQRRFAAPTEAAPAANNEGAEWGDTDVAAGGAWQGALPLLM
ncbi:transglutaminase-like cysteine peptidase [Bradyrhizobium diazoefficiens]|uniref:transglutaminase-like cysteine peptidase n=1 Tax=Bradyrhizobium diazoefficiens TaxID=1355477 RepID=UPI0034E38B4F